MHGRVLIVEDDALQRDILESMLTRQGYYVEVSGNGLDAIRKARLGWFDVVLMDYRLPEVDGLAAARLIAEITKDGRSPRMIALTANPEHLLNREAGTDSVFYAIEEKPFDPEHLLSVVRSALPEVPAISADSAWPKPRVDPLAQDNREPSDGARVLVVEDDDLLRSLFTSALERQGYAVDAAGTGLEALWMIAAHRYDVAILDYHLPEIDGLAAARLANDLVATGERPRLIALTATPQVVHDQEAGALSAFDDIIAKSDGIQAVLSAVEKCVFYQHHRAVTNTVSITDIAATLMFDEEVRETA